MACFIEANSFERIKLVDDLRSVTDTMSARRMHTVVEFAKQISAIHDVDAIDAFLKWKDDPVIDTILTLVSTMDDDDRNEILHSIEDMSGENPKKFAMQYRRDR